MKLFYFCVHFHWWPTDTALSRTDSRFTYILCEHGNGTVSYWNANQNVHKSTGSTETVTF